MNKILTEFISHNRDISIVRIGQSFVVMKYKSDDGVFYSWAGCENYRTINKALKSAVNAFAADRPCDFYSKFDKWFYNHTGTHPKKQSVDFNGGIKQLQYAIEKDIDPFDYDEWQCVERLLGKNEVSLETALTISQALYKEDLTVFDCEKDVNILYDI